MNKLKIEYIAKCIEKANEKIEKQKKKEELEKRIKQYILHYYPIAINNIKNDYPNIYSLEFVNKKSDFYIAKIYCNFKNYKIDNLTIFIKQNKFDVCYFDVCSYTYQKICSVKYDSLDETSFIKMIVMFIYRHINSYKNKITED